MCWIHQCRQQLLSARIWVDGTLVFTSIVFPNGENRILYVTFQLLVHNKHELRGDPQQYEMKVP